MGTKKILLLDNYDSFTHNLYHLLIRVRPEYEFVIRRNRDRSLGDTGWDGIVVSPGPGKPGDTGALRDFFEGTVLPNRLPYLGICLGMQFLAEYYGLPVVPMEPCHGRQAEVIHGGDGLFRCMANPFLAMRYNSLGISADRKEWKNSPLIILAREKDSSLVMALRHETLPLAGVQYHPESFLTEEPETLINHFFEDYFD